MPKSTKRRAKGSASARSGATGSAAKGSAKTAKDTGGPERPQGEASRRKQGTGHPGPADQIGAILSKGLDLAEAGMSLGLTMVTRMGEVAQQSVSRIAGLDVSPGGVGPAPAAPGEAGPGARTPEPPPSPAPEEAGYYITNRLPLTPGGSFKISFSINNDSMEAPKKVSLRIEGFTGESEGARLAPDGFAVKPSNKTIAPMDFEKFVLEGSVPPDVPQDVYLGAVVVKSGSEFRIPVRLRAL